jgi:hypothetical protein
LGAPIQKRPMLQRLGPMLKYGIDVASLCRAALTLHPIKSLLNINQYNFNAILHAPSGYMKTLDGEKSVQA